MNLNINSILNNKETVKPTPQVTIKPTPQVTVNPTFKIAPQDLNLNKILNNTTAKQGDLGNTTINMGLLAAQSCN